MNEFMKFMYFATVILLAVTGTESKQVSDLAILNIMMIQ